MEVVGCGEVDWIVQPWVCPYPSLKVSRSSVDLSEQLDLKPPFADLHGVCWLGGSAQLGDAEKANLSNEVHQSLRDSHDRADLADAL
ncbi:hypothetical protein GCM10022376_14270 [Yimella lutea]